MNTQVSSLISLSIKSLKKKKKWEETSMLWFYQRNFLLLPSFLQTHFMSLLIRRRKFFFIWNKFLLTNIQVSYVFIVSTTLSLPSSSILCLFISLSNSILSSLATTYTQTDEVYLFSFIHCKRWNLTLFLHVHKLFSLEMFEQIISSE